MGDITTFPPPPKSLSVIVLGAGGREHALAWKLAQSNRVAKVYVCPGNGGTAMVGGKVENVAFPWGGQAGFSGIAAWAREKEVDLVVPGPEQPLVDGVELAFRKCMSVSGYQATQLERLQGWHVRADFLHSWHTRIRPHTRRCSARRLQIPLQIIHGSTSNPHSLLPLLHKRAIPSSNPIPTIEPIPLRTMRHQSFRSCCWKGRSSTRDNT